MQYQAVLAALALALAQAPTPAQTLFSGREAELLDRIRKLEERMAVLEGRAPAAPQPAAVAATTPAAPAVPAVPASEGRDPLGGLTVNAALDAFYSYNFNRPAARTNALRAFDVTSNSFSLNQAALVLERAPDPAAGRRLGLRLDLLYGQATEALQGNPLNEARPAVYRHIFQAYGTWAAPLGRGLSIDFGKFASALGYEGTYTKDQLNYSRSYWFNFLPYYHMGFRTNYAFHHRFNATWWLVNGAQQTEDFNGLKSNAVLLNFKPAPSVSWNVNYYAGREQRQPGTGPTPRGRLHVFDTYASWNPSGRWLLVGEFDTVLSRTFPDDPPSRATGGAAYVRARLAQPFWVAGRFELLKDSGGIFSGASQTLKEGTITATWQPLDGFQARLEYRRDSSNVPCFIGSRGALKKNQDTAALGLIWWFGGKQEGW